MAILNISNVNDLSCDSGVTFQRLLGSATKRLGHEYSIIGPDVEVFRNLNVADLEKFYVKHGVSKYESRFKFDWDGMLSCILNLKPDIIFCNQIELTSPLRAMLTEQMLTDIKLISYCHFIPIAGFAGNQSIVDASLNGVNLGVAILLQFLGAFTSADAVIVQSDFAKWMCLNAARGYGLKEVSDQKIFVLPPPADDQFIVDRDYTSTDSKWVVYNHRLNTHYGTESFYELMKLAKASLSFRLVISDPMPNRSSSRQKIDQSPNYFRNKFALMRETEILSNGNDRKAYQQTLSRSKVSFAALRDMCPWSMASVDCLGMGIPVLAPNRAAYREFIPTELLYNSSEEAVEKLKHLLGDESYWKSMSQTCRNIVDGLGLRAPIVAQKLIDIFTSIQA